MSSLSGVRGALKAYFCVISCSKAHLVAVMLTLCYAVMLSYLTNKDSYIITKLGQNVKTTGTNFRTTGTVTQLNIVVVAVAKSVWTAASLRNDLV